MDINELATRFNDRFRGLKRAHGVYRILEKTDAGSKTKGTARTVSEPVTDTVWRDHLSGTVGVGIVPIDDDASCRWGAVDIDVYDGLNIQEIEQALSEAGMPLVLCRTKSGGVHAFLFLSGAMPASLVRAHLARAAVVIGHPSAEIFPKQTELGGPTDVGNWLNMPYFGGDKTDRYAIVKGNRLTAEAFLEYAKSVEADLSEETLRAWIAAADAAVVKQRSDDYKDCEDLLDGMPPCLRRACLDGISEGNRNKIIFNLAIYAQRRWGKDVSDKVMRINNAFCCPPLHDAEIKASVRSAIRKSGKYKYTCADPALRKNCDRAACKLCRYSGCNGGGEDLGVDMADLQKIDSDPPVWYVTINGRRCSFNDETVLADQKTFAKFAIKKINFVPGDIDPDSWRATINELLENIEIVSAPQDASVSGLLLTLTEEFCADTAPAAELADILNGAVFKDEKFYYFRPADLSKFLDTRRFQKRNEINWIWSTLRQSGAEERTGSFYGKRTKYWAMPRSAFTEQTENAKQRVPDGDF